MYTRILESSRGLRRFAQRWGLLALVILVLGAGWTFVLSTFAAQRQNLTEERQRELAQLNSAVAQQTAGVLKLAETNQRTMEAFMRANPDVDPRRDADFVGLVNMLKRASNGYTEMRLISTEGELFYVPSLDGKPLATVKDRKYFIDQLASTHRTLLIGEPVLSRVTNKWALPITWRLESPIWGISVVLAAIELDRLGMLHEKVRLKPAGTVTLMSTDGTVLSRTPYEQPLVGKSLASSVNFRNEYGVKPRGAFITDNAATDGVSRLISYERLDEYPVIVMVTQGMQDILAPYVQRRNLTIAVGTLVSVLILAFAFLLQRFQRGLHEAQENLQRLATIDSLTGMLTRRAFLEMAQREFSRARRYERPTVVLALDLDRFKQVNDTHGHAVGDTVLRECCAAWFTVLRQQDYVGRVGGEEFCAILPETDIASATHVAERLRQTTARLRFAGVAGEFSVTVSIGLSIISRTDEQLAAVMERADRALYTAKHSGRNRLQVAEAPPSRPVLLKA